MLFNMDPHALAQPCPRTPSQMVWSTPPCVPAYTVFTGCSPGTRGILQGLCVHCCRGRGRRLRETPHWPKSSSLPSESLPSTLAIAAAQVTPGKPSQGQMAGGVWGQQGHESQRETDTPWEQEELYIKGTGPPSRVGMSPFPAPLTVRRQDRLRTLWCPLKMNTQAPVKNC